MMEKLKYSTKLRKIFLGSIIGLSLAPALNSDRRDTALPVPNDTIVKAFAEGRCRNLSDYIDNFSTYKTDTIYINPQIKNKSYIRGRYRLGEGIILNHFKQEVPSSTSDGSKSADFSFLERFNQTFKTNLAHEEVHKNARELFHSKSFFSLSTHKKNNLEIFNLSLRDVAVLSQYDEIFANLGSRIYEREQYLKTGNISSFTNPDAYTDAIVRGQISPRDTSPESREKEYSLMINAVFDRWTAKNKGLYSKKCLQNLNHSISLAESDGTLFPAASNQAEIDKRLKTLYSLPIDGKLVDFSKYIKGREVTPHKDVQKVIDDYSSTHKLYQEPSRPLNMTLMARLHGKGR